MAHSSSALSFTHYGWYTTAGGEREVAAAYDPDRQVYVLVDALAEPFDSELDAQIVDDTLQTAAETEALARDYLGRTRDACRPLAS